MRLAQHTIWIARTPEQVFDFFTDFSQGPRWRQYVSSMKLVSDGPLSVGSRIHVRVDVMGTASEYDLHVLAFERPRLWRHHTNDRHYGGYVEYRFEPESSGTRVTMTMVAKPKGWYGWLSVPILLLQRQKPYAEQLPRLKQVMEG